MKIINNILSFALVATAIVPFSSCEKETVEAENKTFVVEAAETGLTFLSDTKEPQTIEFTANGKWTASVDAAWVTITPASGEVDGNIAVTVVENTTTNARTAKISIKDVATSITQVVEVKQASKSQQIVINKEFATLKYGKEVLTDTISVTANYDWDITNVPAWLSYEDISSSRNLSKRIVLHADVDKLSQFEEVAEIIFKDKSNAFEDFKFAVNYTGFEPAISFKSGIGVELDDVVNNTFDFDINEYNEIKVKLTVTSNYEFDINNISEYITEFKDLYPNVIVKNGFETTKQYFITFDNTKLDTDDVFATFEIAPKSLKEVKDISLSARVAGVGENYIYSDFSKFKRDMEGTGFFRFEAGSRNPQTWEKEGYILDTLKMVTSKPLSANENEWPFAIFVADVWNGFAVYPNMPINWVYVDNITNFNAKTPVNESSFQIEVGLRGDYTDFTPGVKREFSLFVVERTSPDMKLEDLFDEYGDVLPQYENSYQLFMQDPKKVEYDFIVPEMPNFEMQVAADQGPSTFTISIDGVYDPIALNFWTNYNVVNDKVTGSPWYESDVDDIVKTFEMKYDFDNAVYVINLTFHKNETGKERTRFYGFTVFENEMENPGFGFEITQAAK